MTNGEQRDDRMPVTLRVAFTLLVMKRKSWVRYTTLLFPIPLAIAAPTAAAPTYEFLILFAFLALTTAAVVLIFLPSSRAYFDGRRAQSSGLKPISQRMP